MFRAADARPCASADWFKAAASEVIRNTTALPLGSLLEAEVVTADGQIRIANACTNPDLFWALKGGGGGSFGVVSKMTLRVHDLPEFFGTVNFTIKAASDDAYRRLIREFVSFYAEHLFNDHWGEQAHLKPDNTLDISMALTGVGHSSRQKRSGSRFWTGSRVRRGIFD